MRVLAQQLLPHPVDEEHDVATCVGKAERVVEAEVGSGDDGRCRRHDLVQAVAARRSGSTHAVPLVAAESRRANSSRRSTAAPPSAAELSRSEKSSPVRLPV